MHMANKAGRQDEDKQDWEREKHSPRVNHVLLHGVARSVRGFDKRKRDHYFLNRFRRSTIFRVSNFLIVVYSLQSNHG